LDLPFPKKEWARQEWDQIKNLSKIDLISLLNKDGRWEFIKAKGNQYIYRNPKLKPPFNYLAIHYHKEGFRNKGLLKQLLNQWCCTKEDLKRWKVIK
jgi:predicted RNA binding protein YcfA (HicA-like mRNA interferase family)